MAVIKVEWTVDRLANVMTQFDVCKVYRSTTGATGVFSEITGPGTRVTLVAGTTDYYFDDTTGDSTYWYKVSYYHETTTLEGDSSEAFQAAGGGNYVSLQDFRDWGFTEAQVSDARLLEVITQAEAFVEDVTGRWFYPKEMVIRVDGNGSPILPLQIPIIQIDQIRVLSVWAEIGTVYGDVTLDNVRVSNRHLTQGLLRPDDRDAPSLEFVVYELLPKGHQQHVSQWYDGRQNVELTGWWGYTELQPGDSVGETAEGSQIPLSKGSAPTLIKRACMLLASRWLPTPADPDAYEDATRKWQVEKYKTRDQEIVFGKQTMFRGDITGDPEVDRLLSMFVEPVEMAFV